MHLQFQGKKVFLTGAASGIGYAQASAFLARGARVFGFDQEIKGLQQLQMTYGEAFQYAIGSVKEADQVQDAVQQAIDKFQKIDVLLNTAGVLDDFKKTTETDEQLWDHIIDTNVKGTFLVTNAVLPHMLTAQQGVIINMASIAGMIPGGGGAAYTTSKHAIVGYTKQVDYDYCRAGIRVNAIAPGAIQTPMNQKDFEGTGDMAKWVADQTPAGRWAMPEEVAHLTLFIASDLADYMHGNIIPLDGGWLNKG